MKKLIRICFALCTVAGIAVAGLLGVAFFYESEIVSGVQLKINQKLDARVDVQSVELSVLERFPYASIKFNEVWIEDKNISGDTLLYADVLYLSFNMMDIVNKQYVIKQAEINNGNIRMRQGDDGANNFVFWKETESDDTSIVEFDIEDLILKDVDYSYELNEDEFMLTGQIHQLKLAGSFDDSGMILANEADFRLHELQYDKVDYIVNQDTKIAGEISLNSNYEQLTFNDFHLSFGDMKLPISGRIFEEKDNWNIDLKTKNSGKIKDLLTVLSPEVNQQFSEYKLKGNMSYSASLTGEVSEKTIPLLAVNFQVSDGLVKEKESGVSLEQLTCRGTYRSLENASERVEITNLTGQLAGGQISANGAIENFSSPWLNMHCEADFNLNSLGQFLQMEQINDIAGKVAIRTDFKGPMPTSEITRVDIDRLKMTGDMQVSGLNLKIKDSAQEFAALSGEVIFNDDDLKISQLSGAVNGNDFKASGELTGFMHYLFDKQDKLLLTGHIQSDFIDLNTLLVEDGSDGEEEEHFAFNDKLDFNLSADISRLIFKNFEADDIRGDLTLNSQLLQVKNVEFHAAGGSLLGGLMVRNSSKNDFAITSNIKIKDVNIEEVFSQFDNFGQEFIQDRHLKGKGTATISYSSSMTPSLDIDPTSIACDADITITDGELRDLEALQDVYKAMTEHKIIRSKIDPKLKSELSHIQFSTLTNKIQIRHGNVNIPAMKIASSAMDLNVSGTHSIDNKIDYHLDFRLRDLLVKRTETEFGVIADDGTGMNIFILMNGTADNPNFNIDWEKRKEKRKEDFIAEKNTAKSILKEELGLFKNHKTEPVQKEVENDKPIITVISNKDDKDVVEKKEEEDFLEDFDDDDDF